jgi:nucleoid DNA-binding protein
MKYRNKFEREVVQNVSLRSGLEEDHVYHIYNSFIDAILFLLKQDVCEKVEIPVIGKFELSMPKCRTLYKKLTIDKEFRSLKIDNILTFNFNLYSSLIYYISKFSFKKIY